MPIITLGCIITFLPIFVSKFRKMKTQLIALLLIFSNPFFAQDNKLQKDKDYDSKVLKWIHPKKNQGLGLPAPVLSMLVDLNNNKRLVLNES